MNVDVEVCLYEIDGKDITPKIPNKYIHFKSHGIHNDWCVIEIDGKSYTVVANHATGAINRCIKSWNER